VPVVGTHPAFIAGLARSVALARAGVGSFTTTGTRCAPPASRCPFLLSQ